MSAWIVGIRLTRHRHGQLSPRPPIPGSRRPSDIWRLTLFLFLYISRLNSRPRNKTQRNVRANLYAKSHRFGPPSQTGRPLGRDGCVLLGPWRLLVGFSVSPGGSMHEKRLLCMSIMSHGCKPRIHPERNYCFS